MFTEVLADELTHSGCPCLPNPGVCGHKLLDADVNDIRDGVNIVKLKLSS